jgi:hypothetical protein
MPKYHGVDSQTYRKFVIDAGEVRIGYTDESTRGTRLGATRGGSTFTIEQDVKDMAVDGAKGPVKGGRRIIKSNAKLECSFIEISQDLISLALPGSTTEEFGSPATHESIKRALQIAATDYSSNIALIGEVSGSGVPVVVIINNALADGNFELGLVDNDESVLKVQFTAHFDPSDLETEPWEIRYPLDVLTTEGA